MKVILLQDVAKIGRRNAVVEVPDGLAQNSLFPQKKAVPSTPENLKKLKAQTAHHEAEAKEIQNSFEGAVKLLSDKNIVVAKKANPSGHLFEAVKVNEVMEALDKMSITLPTSLINVPNGIKEVGTHHVYLEHGGKKVAVNLEVKSI